MPRLKDNQSEDTLAVCGECQGQRIIVDSSSATLCADMCSACTGTDLQWSERECLSNAANLITAANIPSAYLEAFKRADLLPEIQNWIDSITNSEPQAGLFLHGPPGVGKTFQAVSLIGVALRLNLSAFYLDASSHVADLRRSHQTHHGDQARNALVSKIGEIRRRVRSFDLVVIDSLARGASITEWAADQYAELIQSRHDTGKPTVYISSHGPIAVNSLEGKSLSEKIGETAAHKVLSGLCLEIAARADQRQADADYSIINIRVRNVSQEESTLLHLWSRTGVFKVVSTRERARLTQLSKVDSREIIEVPGVREFVAWGGYHVIQTGPVVDYYDCAVLIAVMRLYHQRGKNGLVGFHLSELVGALEVKSRNAGSIHKSLKRSLNRLVEANVRIRSPDSKRLVWSEGFLDGVMTEGIGTRAKLVVRLNPHVVEHYAQSRYSLLNVPAMTQLGSQYAVGLFRCLVSHRDAYKHIGMQKWREILGVSEEVADKELRRKLKVALAELVSAGLLTDASRIDERDVLHTHLVRGEYTE